MPPFVRLPDVEMSEDGDPRKNYLDPTTTCPVFQRTGECKHGLKCRFLGNHVRTREDGELELAVDEEKKARVAAVETEVNFLDGDTLRKIRTKKVCLVWFETSEHSPPDGQRLLVVSASYCRRVSARGQERERRRKAGRRGAAIRRPSCARHQLVTCRKHSCYSNSVCKRRGGSCR